MPSETIFDVAIIGAGPGGYATALRAAKAGLNVLLVEKKDAGGVCLNEGCIPSKIWLHWGHLFDEVSQATKLGILGDGRNAFNFAALQKYRESKVSALRNGIEGLENANGVTYIKGTARIASASGSTKQIQVGNDYYTCKTLIIATGAKPRVLPFAKDAYDGVHVMSFEQVFFLNELPGTLGVIGGGAIGLELADFFASLGVNVHVLEAQPSVLMMEDAEVRTVLTKALRAKGIEITTGAKASGIQVSEYGGNCRVLYESQGENHTLVVDKVLLAIGIVPHTGDLGLEEAGIETDQGGFIKVDPVTYETNVLGVYAIGDVARGRFAHEAEAHGERVIEMILHPGEYPRIDPRFVPGCVFTNPQVASFGFKEDEARTARSGHDIRVGKARYEQIGRGIAFGDKGFVKIVVDYCCLGGEVLGAHIVGPSAEYLVQILSVALAQEANLSSLKKAILIHPTLPEALKEAVADVEGNALHALPKKK